MTDAELAAQAVAYLRTEADFNRSWADGRRGADRNFPEAYKARRRELAEERERWADAIERLARSSAAPDDVQAKLDAGDNIGALARETAPRRRGRKRRR